MVWGGVPCLCESRAALWGLTRARGGARCGAGLPRTPRAVLKRGTARFSWTRRGRGSVGFATGLSKASWACAQGGAAACQEESVNGGANCDPGAHSTSATDSFVGTKLLRVAAINSNRAPAEITCNLPSACKSRQYRRGLRSDRAKGRRVSAAQRNETPRLAAVRADNFY